MWPIVSQKPRERCSKDLPSKSHKISICQAFDLYDDDDDDDDDDDGQCPKVHCNLILLPALIT